MGIFPCSLNSYLPPDTKLTKYIIQPVFIGDFTGDFAEEMEAAVNVYGEYVTSNMISGWFRHPFSFCKGICLYWPSNSLAAIEKYNDITCELKAKM